MRIIFTGSGEFGLPTLKALMSAGHKIVSVYTQPDRPAGRGRKITPTPIGQYALSQNLPVTRTPNLNAEQLSDADLMIVIAFGQKIAPEIVDHPRHGSINLHASLLPRLRGAAPINWAILRGDTETGNSVIRLAAKMDAGAVLGQSRCAIGAAETAGELHDRLAIAGAPLVLEVIAKLFAGSLDESQQDGSLATLAPKLNRESAILDWTLSGSQIARCIRGLYPWPGCRVRVLDAADGEISRLTLVRAVSAPGEGPRWRAGEITSVGAVASGSDAVKILEVQPEGKRSMSLADYHRGNPWMPGMRLESLR